MFIRCYLQGVGVSTVESTIRRGSGKPSQTGETGISVVLVGVK